MINANQKWYAGGVDDQIWGEVDLSETKTVIDDYGEWDTGELNLEKIVKGLDDIFKICIDIEDIPHIKQYDGLSIDEIDKLENYEKTYSGDLVPKGHDVIKYHRVGTYIIE